MKPHLDDCNDVLLDRFVHAEEKLHDQRMRSADLNTVMQSIPAPKLITPHSKTTSNNNPSLCCKARGWITATNLRPMIDASAACRSASASRSSGRMLSA
eukprot:245435-Rhodomonas_salina.1